jgi:hypothetical protein
MLRPKKNWIHAAGVAWPLLVDAGSQRKTLTYTAVADSGPEINRMKGFHSECR